MSQKIKKARGKKSVTKLKNSKCISLKKNELQENNMNNNSSIKKFEGFKNFIEAIEFFNKENEKYESLLNNLSDEKENNLTQISIPYAYIGGSYDTKKKFYGYGGLIIYNNKKYLIQGKGNDENLSNLCNISGKIISCQETVKKAIELGINNLNLFYDFKQIEEWAAGRCKSNKNAIINFYQYMQSIKSKIKINFIFIKARSNKENIEAKKLAKEALKNFNN